MHVGVKAYGAGSPLGDPAGLRAGAITRSRRRPESLLTLPAGAPPQGRFRTTARPGGRAISLLFPHRLTEVRRSPEGPQT